MGVMYSHLKCWGKVCHNIQIMITGIKAHFKSLFLDLRRQKAFYFKSFLCVRYMKPFDCTITKIIIQNIIHCSHLHLSRAAIIDGVLLTLHNLMCLRLIWTS